MTFCLHWITLNLNSDKKKKKKGSMQDVEVDAERPAEV